MNTEPYFSHRSCYVNFAEHLQNAWTPNMFYPGKPNRWSQDNWTAFLKMIKSFGFNCFECWLAPTLFDSQALTGGGIYSEFAQQMQQLRDTAHSVGLQLKVLIIPNCIGPEWFFACPNDPEQKKFILDLWRHWNRELDGTDIIGIFPGDPGGCNRNGCNHETFVDLALELSEITKEVNEIARVEIGTWGTPFSGWGSDLWKVSDCGGSWEEITDPRHATPETPVHIWNGKPARAKQAMEYLISRLTDFPDDTMVAINLGFSPDADALMGGDARNYARAIAAIRQIVSWDYSVSEGELINYPHWRLPRVSARRREEHSAAPYSGGMCYTMTPKLNLLTLYAAGRFFTNPDADPDMVSRDFCSAVFGQDNAVIGELFEAFEVVQGWGHYPRRQWSREVLVDKYSEIIERLECTDTSCCSLPLFPDPDVYRADLLWFARAFREMAGPNPDRNRIRQEYWNKALSIYDVIPMSADRRAHAAAEQFSQIFV